MFAATSHGSREELPSKVTGESDPTILLLPPTISATRSSGKTVTQASAKFLASGATPAGFASKHSKCYVVNVRARQRATFGVRPQARDALGQASSIN